MTTSTLWKIVDILRLVRRIGLFSTVKLMACSAYCRKEYKIRAPGYSLPIVLRGQTTDAWVFDQVIVREQYRISLPFTPKRIIDAGANIGLTSLFFNRIFPQANIIAIEPDQNNARMIRVNTSHCEKIHLLEAALWSENCRLSFTVPNDEKCALRVNADRQNGDILGVTIDSALSTYGWNSVDILKMDIEGAEFHVFSCKDKSWLSRVKTLVIELHEDVAPGCGRALFEAARNLEYVISWQGENLILRNLGTIVSDYDEH